MKSKDGGTGEMANFFGGGGNDTNPADAGNDSIYGAGGRDTLQGAGGNDSIYGGSGNDSMSGGTGNDLLDGGSGNDTQLGGDGDDTFILTNGFGTDVLTGGEAGETSGDTINASALTSAVTVNVTGAESGTLTNGANSASFSEVESFVLTGQSDTLNASGSTSTVNVTAGQGNDTLTGGSANDTLNGEVGNDSITGGAGNDVLTGSGSGTTTGSGQVNWSSLGDGNSIATGENFSSGGLNVAVTYSDDGVGQTAASETGQTMYVAGGEPFNTSSSLYLQGNGTGANSTTTLNFSATPGGGMDGTATNVTFRINDIDQQAWQDVITVNAYDAAGNLITVTFTPSSTGGTADTVSGNTITAGNQSNEPNQAAGSVLVSIPGPVARIEIIYANAGTGNQYIYVTDIHYTTTYADHDTLVGGDGNDVAYGGTGNDSLTGDAGLDTLYGGTGNDQIYGGADNDTILFGAGNDSVYGGTGDDQIDDISGGQEDGANYIEAGDGNDWVWSGNDSDTVLGGAGSDTISGESGNDSLSGDDGDDTLYGGAGDDTLSGGNNNDRLEGGDNDDLLDGGSGDDALQGDAGNDILVGGDGNDSLVGGLGDDALYGGAGDEVFAAEAGSDTIDGGTGNDSFEGGLGDNISGGENAGDNDTLDLTAWGWSLTNVIYDPMNPENGTVQFLDASGAVIGTMSFSNIEQVVTCFTPGTLIETARGPVPVEALTVGDLVLTRDHGLQPLRWIGCRDLSLADLIVRPQLQPIRIAQGALGAGLPARDMLVSPQHRMLIEGARAEMLFGEPEVLVAAVHLTALPGVAAELLHGVRYVHLMFDAHELVLADGAWSESFQPAERTLADMDEAQRDEIVTLFPDLAETVAGFPAARLSLKAHEARVLLAA